MSATTETTTKTTAAACFLCLERTITGKQGPCRNCDPEKEEGEDEKAICIYCTDPTDGACCCAEAMDKYTKVQCEFCEIYYNYALAGEGWSEPCVKCNEAYIADFKAAKK
jgi:hypothetical protein